MSLTLLGAGALQPAEAGQAGEILKATGVKGGLVVHLGCGDGKLTAALCAGEAYLVHGLDANAANVEKARKHIRALKRCGDVSVERWSGKSLPYADNLVNLLVADDLGGVAMDEVMRVLCPNGVAYVKAGGRWTQTVKPWPGQMDEWTHYLHDATGNAVAKDTLVGPPGRIQWVANPPYSRSHEIDSSISALVSADGRIFYVLDEGLTGVTDERLPAMWSLVARDAFNGVLLWKRPVPRWGWREWKKPILAGKDWTGLRGQRTRSPLVLPRRLVAEGNRIYVTLGYKAPLTALDAATGQILRTYEGTVGTDEIVCSRGVLALCVRETSATASQQPAKTRAKKSGKPSPKRRGGRSFGQAGPGTILAVAADTGKPLWKEAMPRILPLTLAISGDRVLFHNYEGIVCLSLKTGSELWKTRTERIRGGGWGSAHTLVAHNGVVLFVGPKELVALSAETGKRLWGGPGGKGPGVSNPPDLFVADGLVWHGGPEGGHQRMSTRVKKSGRDPITGEVARTVEVPCLISPGHHFRCYRSKATDRYLLWPKRGVEFLDLKGTNHMRHDWLRPPCKFGVMPCNGLLYAAPHQCFCYPGVKLGGFNALAPSAQPKRGRPADRVDTRLQKGVAYGATTNPPSQTDPDDWPMHRHDPKRSGSTASSVPAPVAPVWQVELGGRITPPVAVAGKLLVASVDAHRISCLDAKAGRPVWHYTAGGRVDSPPSVYKGLVLFGSADGWVYCLRFTDGKLVWRFRAAPEARRVVAFGQLASAWPVHGSVLVKDGVAYCAAGRSSYLDGGIYLYGLDPKTGKTLHEGRLDGPHPDVNKDVGRPFDMEGTFCDVLVTDGEYLYMQQIMLDAKLAEREAPRLSVMGDRKVGRHLFSTAGMLDGSGWNRTFWMYTERWPGFYIANQSPKAGQLLVFDATTTYGVKCFTTRNRHSPMFFPGTKGYLLFADDNETEPVLVGKEGRPKPVKWLPTVNKAVGFALDDPAIDRDKGTGFTRTRPPKWAAWVPVRVRAMVLAGKHLFVAGPPDVVDPADPMAAFEGRKGAMLWTVSAADGSKLAERKLDSPPVFDGMIAANGRLYISTRSGRLMCMGSKG